MRDCRAISGVVLLWSHLLPYKGSVSFGLTRNIDSSSYMPPCFQMGSRAAKASISAALNVLVLTFLITGALSLRLRWSFSFMQPLTLSFVCVCLFIFLPLLVPLCKSSFLLFAFSVCLPVCLPVCRPVSLSVPLSVSLSLFLDLACSRDERPKADTISPSSKGTPMQCRLGS